MGTLTSAVISTTYKKLIFQKDGDNKIWYTNGSDVDTEITTFASALTLSGLITASAGIKLSNSLIYDSSGNEGIKVTATGSAINYLDVINSATGNAVTLDVDGTDSNIGLTLDAKGSGVVTSTPQFVATAGVKLGNNIIYASDGGSTITLDTSDNVTVLGDMTVTGGDLTLGADADGTDRSIVFGHTTTKTIMGIDDTHDSLIIHTGSTFQTTLLDNDFILDGSGNLTIGNGELRTAKIAYTDGDDAITIANGGGITTSAGLTVAGNLTFTGARDILFTDASGLEIKDTGGSTYFAMVSDAITVSQPMTCSGRVLLSGNTGLSAGSGITAASGEVYKSWIERCGSVIKTSIYIDMNSLQANGDQKVIGKDGGTANCHLGQVTTALNGAIVGGKMTCLEEPATGDRDIDLCFDDASTGAEAADLTGETDLIVRNGDWTTGEMRTFGTVITADNYLYLRTGTNASDATYSAGKFLIELWGTV